MQIIEVHEIYQVKWYTMVKGMWIEVRHYQAHLNLRVCKSNHQIRYSYTNSKLTSFVKHSRFTRILWQRWESSHWPCWTVMRRKI